MRILFLANEYPPDPSGGIATYVETAATFLAEGGHEVHVLSCRPGQPETDVQSGRVSVHRRGIPLAWRALRGQAGGRLALALTSARWTRALGPFDVVEAPDWQAQGLRLAGSRGRPPLVVALHGPLTLVGAEHGWNLDRWLANRLESRAARRADGLTASAAATVRDLRRSGWLAPDAHASVAPYPICLERWSAIPPANETEPVVLAVGRIETRKGYDVLLRAMAGLAVPGARLVIVGRSVPGPDGTDGASSLQKLARELGVDLTMTGHLPAEDLPGCFGEARVVAISSRHETFGITGIEALAAGRPLVCSDRAGVRELDDGSGAITVCSPGPAEMSIALRPMLTDPERARVRGEAGRQLVAASCGADRFRAARMADYESAIRAATG